MLVQDGLLGLAAHLPEDGLAGAGSRGSLYETLHHDQEEVQTYRVLAHGVV